MALLDYHFRRFDRLLDVYRRLGDPHVTNKQLRELLTTRAQSYFGTLDDETLQQLSEYFTAKSLDTD